MVDQKTISVDVFLFRVGKLLSVPSALQASLDRSRSSLLLEKEETQLAAATKTLAAAKPTCSVESTPRLLLLRQHGVQNKTRFELNRRDVVINDGFCQDMLGVLV